MFRIAICDDEPVFLEKIKNNIELLFKNEDISCKVDCFVSGEDFLKDKQFTNYDALFLDIELQKMNGIDIARTIRDSGYLNFIVFITSFINYSSLGYQVSAFRYILKVNLEDELRECIFMMIDKLGLKQIIINGISVSINDIMYVESSNHKLSTHLKNGTIIEEYSTLNYFEQKLNVDRLLRVHQSYLVNVQYIETIKGYQITLNNNEIIPVPKSKYSIVKNKIRIKKMLWR